MKFSFFHLMPYRLLDMTERHKHRAAWVVLLGLAANLHAQSFPAGPITIVVPLAPGDAADMSRPNTAGRSPRFAPGLGLVASMAGGIPKAYAWADRHYRARCARTGVCQSRAPGRVACSVDRALRLRGF